MEDLAFVVRISREISGILKEITPLVASAPIDDMGLKTLFHEAIVHSEGLSFLDNPNLERFAQNNYEFLDVLRAILLRFLNCERNRTFADQEAILELKIRVETAITSLTSLPFSQKLADEKKQPFKTNDKGTVPLLLTREIFNSQLFIL